MMLEAHALCKNLGGIQAVQRVSLELAEGGIAALIGPNGAGKSTLFGLLSGFLRPDSGSVRFLERDTTRLAPHVICRMGLTRTFQIVQPFAAQSVRDNIAVGAHLHERSRARALALAEQVAQRVGLADQLDKLASSLTVAGRKRLELARALATRPRLLLLDEVLAGLNPQEIAAMIPVIQGLRESGVTVLMIEHVMQAVMRLAQTIWVLSQGELIAQGAPAEIAAHPRVIDAYLGHGTLDRLRQMRGRADHA
jgi:branched-chain amino acid transport system ATP-binding protein